MTTVLLNTVTRRLEVFSSARDVQARAEIATHTAAADPHPQYLGKASAAAIATSGDAADLVSGTVPDGRMPTWAGYTAGSKAALQAASVPIAVQAVELFGYAAEGDGGGALYKRAPSEPAHSAKIQSADGAWWELANRVSRVQVFGAAGDGTTDDSAAFAAAESLGRLTVIPQSANGYAIASPVTTTSGAWLPDPTLTWAHLGSGNLNMKRGFYTSSSPNGANIWRFSDRVFVGAAATELAGDLLSGLGGGTSFFRSDANAPAYVTRDAQVVSISQNGTIAFGAASRSSDQDTIASSCIGFASVVINDKAGGKAWGLITETQHEPGAAWTACAEFNSKNKGADETSTPYSRKNSAKGLWIAAGGDDTFGGASVNPSDSAVTILKHADPAHGWNKGIIFDATALTGSDGVTGTAIAIEMAKGHTIRWLAPGNLEGAVIRSDVSDAGSSSALVFINKGVWLTTEPGKRYFQANYPDGAVNFTHLVGSVSGSPVQFAADGDDADIDLQLTPKGTGVVRFGTHAAIGAETVDGYITIKDAAGTVRKLATVA